MGQGQGREDVSEEIENEGQMEGLQGEENKVFIVYFFELFRS
jgi:hypothetical protein